MGVPGLPSPFPLLPFPLGGLRGGHRRLLGRGGCVAPCCFRVVCMGDRRSWGQGSGEGGGGEMKGLISFSSG